MDQESLQEELSCAENSENPFRTARVLIRNKSSEACWSAFSAKLGNLSCPNRDFLCEGFNTFLSGRQYKILDAYAIGIADGFGNTSELMPTAVFATPWSARYSYSFSLQAGTSSLDVTYSLSYGPQPSLVTQFSTSLPDAVADDIRIVVRPLISLSPFSSADCAQGISTTASKDNCLLCTSNAASVEFRSKTAIRTTPMDFLQQWDCKLGFGERKKESGAMVPRPARATSRVAGEIEFATRQNGAVLVATCFAGAEPPAIQSNLVASPNFAYLASIATNFSKELSTAKKTWTEKEGMRLEWRLYCLSHNFDFEVEGFRGFDSGAMWFRQLWLRDAFEALHSNFDFFLRCEPGKVRSLILSGLSMQDSTGLIPTRVGIGGDRSSNGLDSTLLCMLCACRYCEVTADAEVAKAVSHALRRFLSQAYGKKNAVALDYGLLSCPASYSWIDSCKNMEDGDEKFLVPYRIPTEWMGTTAKEQKEAATAGYYLVETNALWVLLLRRASRLSIPRKNEIEWLYKLSQRNFYEVFSHGDFLAHIASAQDPFSTYDTSFCSASLVAYSEVPHLFRKAELLAALERVKKNLVFRNGKVFGVPVRSGAGFEESFEGDAQYHGNVCWPRDSPYLYKFLSLCNQPDLAEQVLRSSLEQEFSESTIGYCPELFALDRDKEPVPVKNPAQFWSQFADPYLDFLKKKAQAEN